MTVAVACARLTAHYDRVRRLRMQDVPLLNAALSVEAVGFAEGETPGTYEGVLITPWFMSLVRLPHASEAIASGGASLASSPMRADIGDRVCRVFGAMEFDFLVADGEPLGPHETCSLFSPMDAFADQAQARATALEVLALVRAPALTPASLPTSTRASAPASTPAPDSTRTPSSPSRRAFFGGRRAMPVPAGPR